MTQPRRRRGVLPLVGSLLVTALAATLTVGPLTTPAAAVAPTPLSILVLGDSYSAGNGAGNYETGVCYRSPDNYAGVFSTLVGNATGTPPTVDNQACSGAKTTDFWNMQQGALNPQFLAVKNNPDADIIFLTIGGNDVGFSSIVRYCLIPRLDDRAQCKTSLRAAERKLANGTLRKHLRRVLKGIHARTSATTRIVLLGYPYLEGDKTLTFGRIKLGRRLKALQDKGDTLAASLTSTLDTNLGTHNFVFVKTKKLFAGTLPWLRPRDKAHHELFKQRLNRKRWMVQPFKDGIKTAEWYHPNKKGWHRTGELLFRQKSIPHLLLDTGGAWSITSTYPAAVDGTHAVTGGVPPFSAVLEPGLDDPPAWLSLGNKGRTLALSGTPDGQGTWNLQVQVTDGTGRQVVVPVTLQVQ